MIFILLHSTKKKQKKIKEFIEKQEAKLEATRKLNDVVSEVKKITEVEGKEEDVSPSEVIQVEEVHFQEEPEETVNTSEKQEDENTEIKGEEKEENTKKSKKELKKERKEAKRKAKEEKKLKKEAFFQDEVDATEAKLEDEIKNIDHPVEEDTGVYDIFEDDRKKNKKKK